MTIKDVFARLGFDEKEASVYLCLLRTGPSRVTKVARETGIERRSAYEVLYRLLNKKAAFVTLKNNVQHFDAADPKRILEDIREREREFRQILPQLEEMSSMPEEDITIDVLSGKEGLRTVFRDVLNTEKELLSFGAYMRYDETDYLLWTQFLRDIAHKKIPERALYTEEERLLETPHGEYRKLSLEHSLPTSVMIYGNKVAITIFGKNTYSIVRIENKDVADSYRKYFQRYWNDDKST